MAPFNFHSTWHVKYVLLVPNYCYRNQINTYIHNTHIPHFCFRQPKLAALHSSWESIPIIPHPSTNLDFFGFALDPPLLPSSVASFQSPVTFYLQYRNRCRRSFVQRSRNLLGLTVYVQKILLFPPVNPTDLIRVCNSLNCTARVSRRTRREKKTNSSSLTEMQIGQKRKAAGHSSHVSLRHSLLTPRPALKPTYRWLVCSAHRKWPADRPPGRSLRKRGSV